jgi:hypothetical protein
MNTGSISEFEDAVVNIALREIYNALQDKLLYTVQSHVIQKGKTLILRHSPWKRFTSPTVRPYLGSHSVFKVNVVK